MGPGAGGGHAVEGLVSLGTRSSAPRLGFTEHRSDSSRPAMRSRSPRKQDACPCPGFDAGFLLLLRKGGPHDQEMNLQGLECACQEATLWPDLHVRLL